MGEYGCMGWSSENPHFRKSPHWGLNPGPSVYKTDALPLSYRGLCLHGLLFLCLGFGLNRAGFGLNRGGGGGESHGSKEISACGDLGMAVAHKHSFGHVISKLNTG